MKLSTVKAGAVWACLLFTTADILPWLISTDVLPLPVIILCVFVMGLGWLGILEKPFFRLIKSMRKFYNEHK